MARIDRKFQKIFAINALNNGQFGSGQDGTKLLTNDIETLQANVAYPLGWLSATIGAKLFPCLEEFQALGYMATYQIAYLFQEGIPEYNSGTTYYQKSLVRKSGTYELYGSITDNNTGNPLTDGANWLFVCNLTSVVAAATESTAGIAKIATSAQVLAGLNDDSFVTPLKLAPYKVPSGTVFDYCGTTAPAGYLLCFGQNVSRATYANLFALIGTDFGAGDGVTTFGIPDLRGRVVAGKDNMGGTPAGRLSGQPLGVNGLTLGASGGQELHTLIEAEMPTHDHNIPTGTNFSSYVNGTPNGVGSRVWNGSSRAHPTDDRGSDAPHNNIQPSFILNKIIKV